MTEFDTFARRELDGLLRYATVLTGDPDLARDLVQDVMVKAFRRWSLVSAADNQRAYVRTMVTRAFLSWRRSWAVRHVVLPFDELPEGPPTGDHAGAIAERDDALQRLRGLPRRQRSVLVLRYFERLTDNEIAEVLGCSPVTVRGYASRALATLRADPHPDFAVTSSIKEHS
ncbi:RNA polymerase sigma-70 factor, sigma-E family [Jatrophihabitans endophyticus]|uniref:RNA polymerase sigma-70 factor, sigma-E family n=1 Tax=Jatrophihabitans endophyticus TaxID=1206085 RepID=A0A1M5HIH3_9ACTN|nr:SigE family RNA polymerase sigma factor [Jatrophihabitans endophyticus]SHG15769.1 RNA polymerase sigma-70 factor, sigma-E family [Jatrophihabitans endophyticus]